MNRFPVVLIHGAWLHVSSWESWAGCLADRGFSVCMPGWPGEPATVDEARRHPGRLRSLGLEELTDHYERIVRSFDTPPVLIGHSVGGVIAQHLIGENLGRAAVAIAPAPINDVPLTAPGVRLRPPFSGDPAGGDAQVPLSSVQFRHVFANAVKAEEAAKIFEHYVVVTPRRLLADLGCQGAARHPRATANVGNTARGPLLLISGQEDRIVADSVTRAVYKLYGDSVAASSLKQFADRGHSLIVDSGWRAVADHVLGWLAGHGIRAERPGS